MSEHKLETDYAFELAHGRFMDVHNQSQWKTQTLKAFDEMCEAGTTKWPDWFKPIGTQPRKTRARKAPATNATHPPIKGDK